MYDSVGTMYDPASMYDVRLDDEKQCCQAASAAVTVSE